MNIRTSLKTICAACSLALIATAFTGLAPASATVGAGLQLASATSPIDSSQTKSVTVTCPGDAYVTGTGAQISIAKAGKAALVSVTPLPGLKAVTVVAAETGKGTTQNWYLKAYANCVEPVFGIYLAKATSPIDSVNKLVTANCPSGWSLSGTGGQVSSPDAGKVFLHGINVSLTSVTAGAVENGTGTSNNWYVTAYAICVQNGAVPGLQLVSSTTAVDSSHAKSAEALCPAGKRVLGAAAQLTTPDPNRVIIEDMNAVPNLSGVTTVAAEGTGATAQGWIVTSYAFCASL